MTGSSYFSQFLVGMMVFLFEMISLLLVIVKFALSWQQEAIRSVFPIKNDFLVEITQFLLEFAKYVVVRRDQ